MTQLLPPKKEVALALLERSNVDVYLDPRAKGVVVPPQFRKEPRLILKIGRNMPVPIPDLRLDDESMSCTLSFNRSPFYCVVPWTSVFAMVGEDGRGMVWPDDVPQELAVKAAPSGAGEADRAPGVTREGARPEAALPTARRGGRGSRNGAAARSGDDAGTPSRPASKSKRDKADKGDKVDGGARRKKDEGRPMLVAVPPAPPSEREARADSAQAAGDRASEARRPPPSTREGREGREGIRDGVSAIPSSRPRQPVPPSQRRPDGSVAAGPRPKRELPPYLRVVK